MELSDGEIHELRSLLLSIPTLGPGMTSLLGRLSKFDNTQATNSAENYSENQVDQDSGIGKQYHSYQVTCYYSDFWARSRIKPVTSW